MRKVNLKVVEGLGCVPANPVKNPEVGDESIVNFEEKMAIAETKLHGAPDAELAAHLADPHKVDMSKVEPQWPTHMGHCTPGDAAGAAVLLDGEE